MFFSDKPYLLDPSLTHPRVLPRALWGSQVWTLMTCAPF